MAETIDLAAYGLHECPGWRWRAKKPCRKVISADRPFCGWHRRPASAEELAGYIAEKRERPRRKLLKRLVLVKAHIAACLVDNYATATQWRRALGALRAREGRIRRQLDELGVSG